MKRFFIAIGYIALGIASTIFIVTSFIKILIHSNKTQL